MTLQAYDAARDGPGRLAVGSRARLRGSAHRAAAICRIEIRERDIARGPAVWNMRRLTRNELALTFEAPSDSRPRA